MFPFRKAIPLEDVVIVVVSIVVFFSPEQRNIVKCSIAYGERHLGIILLPLKLIFNDDSIA